MCGGSVTFFMRSLGAAFITLGNCVASTSVCMTLSPTAAFLLKLQGHVPDVHCCFTVPGAQLLLPVLLSVLHAVSVSPPAHRVFFLQCFTSCYYYPLYSKYSVFTVMNLKTIFIFSYFLLNSLGNMQPIYSSGLIICI